MSSIRTTPWYRERWPWLLMAGPFFVIVAGFSMLVTAIRTSDGLVADDYYKQGLGINRMIEREEAARDLEIAATLQFNEERSRVRASLSSRAALPASLRMNLVHATRAGADQVIALRQIAPGLYEGPLQPPNPGNWTLQLEDDTHNWRISARWTARAASVSLGAIPTEASWRSD
jgi:hypothetical protein